MQIVLAVPNRKVSLQCPTIQCPTTKYPCSAQRPTDEYSRSGQLQSNHQVSLQCSMATYPCSAQAHSISAVLNGKVSLSCPAFAMLSLTVFTLQCCSAFAVLQGRQSRGRETLHLLCNNGFRVGMLEVKEKVCSTSARLLGGSRKL